MSCAVSWGQDKRQISAKFLCKHWLEEKIFRRLICPPRGALRLEKEEEIPNKFEIGFRGRSDGDLNKAFSQGSCRGLERHRANFLQILFRDGTENPGASFESTPFRSRCCDLSLETERRPPLTTGQKRRPSQIKRG